MKTLFKYLLLVALAAPAASLSMEFQLDRIKLGKELIRAAENKKWAEVERLIMPDADLNQKDTDGWTPLMWAAACDRQDIVRKLIVAGADLNLQTEGGRTALMTAAINGCQEVAQELIIAGANVNLKNKIGYTALMYASFFKHGLMCHLIVDAMLKQARQGFYTFLNCLKKQAPGFRLVSLRRDLFRPLLRDMIQESREKVRQEINRINRDEIKHELLQTYGLL